MPKIKRLPYKTFKYIYARVPRLCVDVVIKTRQGVLLSRRDIPPAKGKWHIPGGTVLWGETLKQAAKRVAREELGISVKIKKIIGVLEYTSKSGFGQSISVEYLVLITSGKISGSEQAKNINFFNTLPNNTIIEQKNFLKKQFNLKCEK